MAPTINSIDKDTWFRTFLCDKVYSQTWLCLVLSYPSAAYIYIYIFIFIYYIYHCSIPIICLGCMEMKQCSIVLSTAHVEHMLMLFVQPTHQHTWRKLAALIYSGGFQNIVRIPIFEVCKCMSFVLTCNAMNRTAFGCHQLLQRLLCCKHSKPFPSTL